MRHAIFMTGTYLLMNLICSYNVFCICMLKLVNMVACVKFFLDGKYSSQYFVDYFFFPLYVVLVIYFSYNVGCLLCFQCV